MSKLDKLKEKYIEVQKKYGLPEFKELNENLSIERMANSESDLIVLEIRRYLMDRIINYLDFSEKLLNPTNVPIGIMILGKNINEKNKKVLNKVYEKLLKNYLSSLKMDFGVYSEKENASAIKTFYKSLIEIKKQLHKIIASAEVEMDKENKEKNSNDYLN